MIAILALQGAFIEHQQMLDRLGVESLLIRNLSDWQLFLSAADVSRGLIIPGGESTAMMRIITDEGLKQPITQAIREGLPVFGTCAGLIMLDHSHLATMDITARRNAYGRQLGSFSTLGEIAGVTAGPAKAFPMVFIRAPYIEEVGPGVEVLATVDGKIVAARQQRQLVTAFHPELTDDTRLHQFFLQLVADDTRLH